MTMEENIDKYLSEEEASYVIMNMVIQGSYEGSEPTKGQIMKDIESKYKNIKVRSIDKSYDRKRKL